MRWVLARQVMCEKAVNGKTTRLRFLQHLFSGSLARSESVLEDHQGDGPETKDGPMKRLRALCGGPLPYCWGVGSGRRCGCASQQCRPDLMAERIRARLSAVVPHSVELRCGTVDEHEWQGRSSNGWRSGTKQVRIAISLPPRAAGSTERAAPSRKRRPKGGTYWIGHEY
jgi:hypothetical protein